jgi:hypothetical protein
MASVILIMIDEKGDGLDLSTHLSYNDHTISDREKKMAHELQTIIDRFLEHNILEAHKEAERRKQSK